MLGYSEFTGNQRLQEFCRTFGAQHWHSRFSHNVAHVVPSQVNKVVGLIVFHRLVNYQLNHCMAIVAQKSQTNHISTSSLGGLGYGKSIVGRGSREVSPSEYQENEKKREEVTSLCSTRETSEREMGMRENRGERERSRQGGIWVFYYVGCDFS